ncbi:MAG: site-specific DNA-methyltransferase [Clostridia bacterium]|nr:site-specific DNA-methyltransferase [Clostridia bacterium]
MDKLKMHSLNKVDDNIKKIGALFPNCVTERKNDAGELEYAIDFDMLKQELSSVVVEGKEERYQFTWPDKKKSILAANAPISDTLRPCREESVDFDTTQNLYIEGDNLAVLKLLQETYLGKIKMIYIDPPYNTSVDFIYKDNFSESLEEYLVHSGQLDEDGNRLFTNTESNGRFHTDWLNMIYPRLKLAKDLLADDGAIFIHIDENEVYTMQAVCKEIFGAQNELGTIVWDKRNPKGVVAGVAYQHESILVFCKNISVFATVPFLKKKEHADEMISKVESLIKKYGTVNEKVRMEYKEWIKNNKSSLSGGESAYSLIDSQGKIYQPVSMAAPDKPETRSHRPLIHPITNKPCPVPEKGWRFTDKKMDELLALDKIEFGADENTQPRQKYFLKDNMEEAVASLLYFGGSDDAMGMPFDNPKPVYVAKRIISTLCKNDDDIILDFFSGSATTAHAVMQLNVEDSLYRKFIMVQLPETIAEKTPAYKQGYRTICEIGKERIRRAGAKIKEENGMMAQNLDTGFRVLKLDSSNMKDVYYTPDEYEINMFDMLSDNIKEDRTPEDLLFQVMLDLGVLLSSKIEKEIIAGKKVFNVADGFLYACFDSNVSEETITAIAKKKPYYFVMRDSSMANDSVATNFEQIFATYSPDTERKVL